MSKKAENRFVAYQREFFNRKAMERRATSVVDQMNADMDVLSEENDILRKRVIDLEKAYAKRGVYLEVERQRNKELHEMAAYYRSERLSWFKAFESCKRAHRTLSKVVRLALTPDEYHKYRRRVGDG